MRIDIDQFGGIAPRINSATVAMNVAQAAENCRLDRGDITPLNGLTSVIGTLPKTGTVQSLYRFQDASEANYWLHWNEIVDVALGVNTSDTTQRVYFADGVKPKWTNFSLATGGGTNYPVVSYDLGVPTPGSAPSAAITTPAADQTPTKQARLYVFTYVTQYGEEGAPSPASTSINVVPGDVVTVSGMAAAPGGNYVMAYKRIYRSEVGADGTIAFYYVGQVAAATTTFVDNVLDVEEQLATEGFAAPPADLRGLVNMPNGIIAGYSGKDLLFCEPFLPYAWPDRYRLTMDYPIVGIASFGQSLLVATTGTAYIVTGTDPATMSMEALTGTRGCVSARSIVSTGDGALYASNDGLIAVGAGGVRNLTEQEFAQSDWLALNPSTMLGEWHEGRYIGFTSAGGIIMDKDGRITTYTGTTPSAAYIDALSGRLYVVTAGRTLSRFEAGTALTARWKSKRIIAGPNFAPACARVEAETYPVTFKVWSDNVLRHTQTVTSDSIFWLPTGIRGSAIEVEVSGTARVRRISLGSSPQELKRGG